MTLPDETLRRAQAVLAAPEADFLTLAQLGGLDIARHFRGADLRDVDFGTDSLAGVVLHEADLRGANLSRARGLTGAMFEGAVADERTVWPPGFHAVREGWAEEWGQDGYGPWASFSVTDGTGRPVAQLLRWCPPGRFLMGSPEDEKGRRGNEGPRHEVVFARGFWMFETAVRQELWQAVMGDNPSSFKGAMLPVTNVSWEDARRFVERLNAAKPGLWADLPSEAQWEYACRAGTETAYSFGALVGAEQVRFGQRRNDGPVPVGSLPANGWGLYEMHGNVYEWCIDMWHDNYEGAPADGSAWIDGGAAYHVFRGGSWFSGARYVRAAYRFRFVPGSRFVSLGLRCARVQ